LVYFFSGPVVPPWIFLPLLRAPDACYSYSMPIFSFSHPHMFNPSRGFTQTTFRQSSFFFFFAPSPPADPLLIFSPSSLFWIKHRLADAWPLFFEKKSTTSRGLTPLFPPTRCGFSKTYVFFLPHLVVHRVGIFHLFLHGPRFFFDVFNITSPAVIELFAGRLFPFAFSVCPGCPSPQSESKRIRVAYAFNGKWRPFIFVLFPPTPRFQLLHREQPDPLFGSFYVLESFSLFFGRLPFPIEGSAHLSFVRSWSRIRVGLSPPQSAPHFRPPPSPSSTSTFPNSSFQKLLFHRTTYTLANSEGSQQLSPVEEAPRVDLATSPDSPPDSF